MKKEWVKYLRDPVDGTRLTLSPESNVADGRISTGILVSRSGNKYKIKKGVPILLTKDTQPIETVESFAYEWEEFDFEHGKDGWLKNIIKPSIETTGYFKDKVVVDCGAGSGRQSRWMAEYGAKLVLCIELSNSVHGIVKKVTDPFKDRVFVIQADISRPPIHIENLNTDLVYCVNVIQHTSNPEQSLIELSNLMGRRSSFLFNIYLTRNRTLSMKILKMLRFVTSHMSYETLKSLSYVATFPVHCLSKITKRNKGLKSLLPPDMSFKEIWLDIYDLLGPHKYQKFYTEKELKSMLKKANLKIVKRRKYVFLLSK